jgi:ZIP family zinc transporter
MATFLTTTQNLTLGLSVGLAIAIHNIPEGIAVAMPIYHVSGKKRTAMLYASLAGITEPIGALVGMAVFAVFLPQFLVGALMSAVAGIMIYLSFDTLLPLAREYGNWHLSMIGIMSGMLVIWLSLILIGG